jgi:hypothetical protein
MANSKTTTSSGIGIGTLVFLIFLTLKLAGIGQVAEWSWWWVTCPLWIPFVIIAIIAIIALIAIAIGELIK